MRPPPHDAVLSPDGTLWWDGTAWEPIPPPVAAGLPVPGGTSIVVADHTVGAMRVDSGQVRAEKIGGQAVSQVQTLQYETGYRQEGRAEVRVGGQPHLVVPLEVAMHHRPANSTLALVSLDATLTLATRDITWRWRCVPLDLIEGMPCRSLPVRASSTTLLVQFALGASDISALERVRQQHVGSTPRNRDGQPFRLGLDFSGRVAGLTTVGDTRARVGGPGDPFGGELGPHSQFSMFWSTRIPAMTLEVDHESWVSAVIPAFKAVLRRGR